MQWKQAWKQFWLKDEPPQEQKSGTNVDILNTLLGLPNASWSEQGYATLAKRAYVQNVVAYKCIKTISEAVGSLRWYLCDSAGNEIENHAVLTLIKRPNPLQGQAAFFTEVEAAKLLGGNSYIEAVRPGPSRPPKELWPCRPDNVTVNRGIDRLPISYSYTAGMNGGVSKTFAVNRVTGQCDLLHLRAYSPLDEIVGLAPAAAAIRSIDSHNEAVAWNKSLLQNGARPSGALKTTGALTEQQQENLKEFIKEMYSGGKNAGKPMVLEGGVDWIEMSITPKDMDFVNTKDSAARDIALALGVPPILLNIPGDSTYNNMREARQSFYEDTVLAEAAFIRDELNRWLLPMFGAGLYIEYDEDCITALAPKREAAWDRIEKSTVLTVNEKRAALGYEPVDGGDDLLINAGLIPINTEIDDSESVVTDEDAEDTEPQEEESDEE